jgi:hypothetical protein
MKKGESHQTYDLISGAGTELIEGRTASMKLMILQKTHSQPKESDE